MKSVVLLVAIASSLGAQTLSQRVAATDGLVQVLFPARPDVCGDGQSFIRTSRGRGNEQTWFDNGTSFGRTSWSSRPCSFGPARALTTVIDGAVTRVSLFVGPVPTTSTETRTINASAADAMTWLGELTARGESRVASKAIQAMMFADAPAPWTLLLRIARDADRPREARQSALTWLAYGVNEKLGLADYDEHGSDDDEMRTQAVFVLTQQSKSQRVPELIDLVRNAKQPAARKAAVFWLGQTGDSRAAEIFAKLLGLE